MVDQDNAACRQLYSRAKKHIAAHRQRFKPSREAHERILATFIQMVHTGKTEDLIDLLAEDVVWYSDGGGRTAAARLPIRGRLPVLRFALGLFHKRPDSTAFEIAEVNGAPAIVVHIARKVATVITIETDGQHIRAIRSIVNPDKLAHL